VQYNEVPVEYSTIRYLLSTVQWGTCWVQYNDIPDEYSTMRYLLSTVKWGTCWLQYNEVDAEYNAMRYLLSRVQWDTCWVQYNEVPAQYSTIFVPLNSFSICNFLVVILRQVCGLFATGFVLPYISTVHHLWQAVCYDIAGHIYLFLPSRVINLNNAEQRRWNYRFTLKITANEG
jgi:hypothetical protein